MLEAFSLWKNRGGGGEAGTGRAFAHQALGSHGCDGGRGEERRDLEFPSKRPWNVHWVDLVILALQHQHGNCLLILSSLPKISENVRGKGETAAPCDSKVGGGNRTQEHNGTRFYCDTSEYLQIL